MPDLAILILCSTIWTVVTSNIDNTPSVVEGIVIGIDFGTSYSRVGVYRNDKVEIIRNEEGSTVTPSYVAFTDRGTLVIGDLAKNQLTKNPFNTVFNIKRMLGRRWSDSNFQKHVTRYPFEVFEYINKPRLKINTSSEVYRFHPEEICAMIIGKMKRIAEDYLGEKVYQAVIAVPSNFNDAQRHAILNSASIAGLKVLKLINEPTAAAIAYGFEQEKRSHEQNILVFDFGGGKLDISILRIDKEIFEVLVTVGDQNLGGELLDQNIVNHFIKIYKRKKRNTLYSSDIQKLYREAERAKRALSTVMNTTFSIDSFYGDEGFSEPFTRAEFEAINSEAFNSALLLVKQALMMAKLPKPDIDEIILVGGSTRIPKIRELLKDFFIGKRLFTDINPDEAVAYGAALQALFLAKKEDTDSILVIDICPLSIGIRLTNDAVSSIIQRHSPIPTSAKKVFTIESNDRRGAVFSVYEGESTVVTNDSFTSDYDLWNVVPLKNDTVYIEVTFEMDNDGLLNVSVANKKLKQYVEKVYDGLRLKPDELDYMRTKNQIFNILEEKQRQKIESLSSLEHHIYCIKAQMNIFQRFKEEKFQKDIQEGNREIFKAIEWLELNEDASQAKYRSKKEDIIRKLLPIVSRISGGRIENFKVICPFQSNPNHDEL